MRQALKRGLASPSGRAKLSGMTGKVMSEETLYRPVHDFLEQRFQDRVKPAYGDLRFMSAITARAGGTNTGIWSKPDLCVIALCRFKYALSWSFDVHGFEVKTTTGCNPTAVHEALNHTSLVSYSHLVWEHPRWDDRDGQCRDIRDRCSRFGVGLIVFSDAANVDSFTVKVAAQRHQPAGDAIEEFIESRLPVDQRHIVLEWVRELR